MAEVADMALSTVRVQEAWCEGVLKAKQYDSVPLGLLPPVKLAMIRQQELTQSLENDPENAAEHSRCRMRLYSATFVAQQQQCVRSTRRDTLIAELAEWKMNKRCHDRRHRLGPLDTLVSVQTRADDLQTRLDALLETPAADDSAATASAALLAQKAKLDETLDWLNFRERTDEEMLHKQLEVNAGPLPAGPLPAPAPMAPAPPPFAPMPPAMVPVAAAVAVPVAHAAVPVAPRVVVAPRAVAPPAVARPLAAAVRSKKRRESAAASRQDDDDDSGEEDRQPPRIPKRQKKQTSTKKRIEEKLNGKASKGKSKATKKPAVQQRAKKHAECSLKQWAFRSDWIPASASCGFPRNPHLKAWEALFVAELKQKNPAWTPTRIKRSTQTFLLSDFPLCVHASAQYRAALLAALAKPVPIFDAPLPPHLAHHTSSPVVPNTDVSPVVPDTDKKRAADKPASASASTGSSAPLASGPPLRAVSVGAPAAASSSSASTAPPPASAASFRAVSPVVAAPARSVSPVVAAALPPAMAASARAASAPAVASSAASASSSAWAWTATVPRPVAAPTRASISLGAAASSTARAALPASAAVPASGASAHNGSVVYLPGTHPSDRAKRLVEKMIQLARFTQVSPRPVCLGGNVLKGECGWCRRVFRWAICSTSRRRRSGKWVW